MVELRLDEAQRFNFELVNSYGKILQAGHCTKKPMKIITSGFPRGLYWLRVWNEKEQLTKTIELK